MEQSKKSLSKGYPAKDCYKKNRNSKHADGLIAPKTLKGQSAAAATTTAAAIHSTL